MADEVKEEIEFNKDAFVAGIKAKYGGAADVALSVLGQEAKEYRIRIRDLKAKLPKEDAIVLTESDAREFNDYKKLLTDSALDFKQVKERIERFPELETNVKELARAESERDAAGAAGFKLSTFKKLMREFPDAEFEIKTQKDKDNREAKVAFIRNDGKESSLDEFAKDNFADFLPALKQEPDTPIKAGNTSDPTPAGQNAATSLFDQIRARAAAEKRDAPVPMSLREIAGRL